MLVKWITAKAPDRVAFSRGQQVWAELRGLPGFLGQCGGWSGSTAGVAQIFAFWRDPAPYRAFMDRAHDRLAARQAGTYHDIRVRLFDHRLDIGPGFPVGLAAVSFLRLAHCQVRQGRRAHFTEAQATVWNPGMTAAPGMRGGVFAQHGEKEFLVLSAWRTPDDHQRYLGERFDRLRKASGLVTDVLAVSGDVVEPEPNWTVPG